MVGTAIFKHYLCEKVWTLTDNELIENGEYILNNYKHARYLWISFTNYVVAIASNCIIYGDNENTNENKNNKDIEELLNQFTGGGNSNINSNKDKMNEILARQPLRQLYCDKKNLDTNKFDINGNYSFADLRDLLLGIDNCDKNTNCELIKQVNKKELKYWKNVGCTIKRYDKVK